MDVVVCSLNEPPQWVIAEEGVPHLQALLKLMNEHDAAERRITDFLQAHPEVLGLIVALKPLAGVSNISRRDVRLVEDLIDTPSEPTRALVEAFQQYSKGRIEGEKYRC